jgi:heme exporter protein A
MSEVGSRRSEVIEAQGLAKYFGRFSALRNLAISVSEGQFIALFGRNGAGKTTFLKILAGLSRPSAGSVKIRADKPGSQTARALTGYLSHNTSLYLDLTAFENLRFYAGLLDISASDADLEQKIANVGLAGRGREPVRNYSRGMQQRLAIARAFLHDPGVLLLDEPFTGLDQAGTEFLKDYLRASHARGKTCLMAIHDEALGYELADRLVVIDKGNVALDLPRQSVRLEDFQQRYRALTEER